MKLTSNGPSQHLGGAMIPLPAKMAQGYQSHGAVNGSPGTDPIPAPRPGGVPQGIKYRNTGSPLFGSDQAPEVFFPGIYYYGADSMETPGQVSYLSDNQMPLPAVDPKGLPSAVQVRPTFLRQNPVTQPASTPVYTSRF